MFAFRDHSIEDSDFPGERGVGAGGGGGGRQFALTSLSWKVQADAA